MSTDLAAAPITGAQVLRATVDELSDRAPAIVAAAVAELGPVVLGIHFGDGSEAQLVTERSRLVVTDGSQRTPTVEVWFDTRAMNLIFDLAGRPVEEVLPRSLDVRGQRPEVLAVWRTLRLLGQRASGLRAVQETWRAFRRQAPDLWGPVDPGPRHTSTTSGLATPRGTGWSALDYLDARTPSDQQPALANGTVNGHARVLWDGYHSRGWWEAERIWDADLLAIMNACRDRTAEEMDRLIPDRSPKTSLYDLMRAYPARQGKGLRPTLTIAACAAFGGRPEDALRVAASLELFHNGFLVHDDIADESTHRRGKPTLHERHGIGLAVNAGDGLNLLAIDGVLSNLESLGLARTLGLIHEILHMCRETVEGQAIELEWIRRKYVPKPDAAYYRMSTKKTGWYTCISPCRLGAVAAGETAPARLDALNEAFRWIGIAFQIQDDVLNLIGQEELYGKEPLGDLLEGKRTVMLIHLVRSASAKDRAWIMDLLRHSRDDRSQDDAERLLAAMGKYGSLDYALDLADRLAHRGIGHFESDLVFVPENEGKGVLRQVANYVITRAL
jgi:geranylgeranyl diphosphate synthase type II